MLQRAEIAVDVVNRIQALRECITKLEGILMVVDTHCLWPKACQQTLDNDILIVINVLLHENLPHAENLMNALLLQVMVKIRTHPPTCARTPPHIPTHTHMHTRIARKAKKIIRALVRAYFGYTRKACLWPSKLRDAPGMHACVMQGLREHACVMPSCARAADIGMLVAAEIGML